MSCNADKAIQDAIQRAVQQRVQEINGRLKQGLDGWSRTVGRGDPSRVSSAVLQHVKAATIRQATRAATEPLLAGLHSILGTVFPRFPASQLAEQVEQREAARNRGLDALHIRLVQAGYPVEQVNEAIDHERCVLHVMDQLTSGELVAAAVETLVVHKQCTGEPMVLALMPRYTSLPLGKALNQLRETLADEPAPRAKEGRHGRD